MDLRLFWPPVQIYSPIHPEGYCVPIALMFYIIL